MGSHIQSFNELFGFSTNEKQLKVFNILVDKANQEINNFDFRTIFSTGLADPMIVQSMLDTAKIDLPSVNLLYPDLFSKHWGRTSQMKELGYTDHPLYSKEYSRNPPVDPNTGASRYVQNPSSETGAKINVDYMGNRGFIPTTFAFLVKGGELTSNTDWLRKEFMMELNRHLKYNKDKIIPTLPTKLNKN